MTICCCIVPEYLLKTIVEKGETPQHVIHACQSTLENSKHLQSFRVEAIVSAQRQSPSEGIIPPYIHEQLLGLLQQQKNGRQLYPHLHMMLSIVQSQDLLTN